MVKTLVAQTWSSVRILSLLTELLDLRNWGGVKRWDAVRGLGVRGLWLPPPVSQARLVGPCEEGGLCDCSLAGLQHCTSKRVERGSISAGHPPRWICSVLPLRVPSWSAAEGGWAAPAPWFADGRRSCTLIRRRRPQPVSLALACPRRSDCKRRGSDPGIPDVSTSVRRYGVRELPARVTTAGSHARLSVYLPERFSLHFQRIYTRVILCDEEHFGRRGFRRNAKRGRMAPPTRPSRRLPAWWRPPSMPFHRRSARLARGGLRDRGC